MAGTGLPTGRASENRGAAVLIAPEGIGARVWDGGQAIGIIGESKGAFQGGDRRVNTPQDKRRASSSGRLLGPHKGPEHFLRITVWPTVARARRR
jgi:hypothetical protein